MEILIAFISGFAAAIFIAHQLGSSPEEETELDPAVDTTPKIHLEQVDAQFFAFDKTTNQFLAQHTNLGDLVHHLSSDGDIIITFETEELENLFTSTFMSDIKGKLHGRTTKL